MTLAHSMNIQTFMGISFNLFNPDPDLINIEDIAHSTANLSRFTGHCRDFYSVAEHSINVASLLPSYLYLEGLFHDSPEAYIGDLSTPLKHSGKVDGFKEIEAGLSMAIEDAFGLGELHSAIIKHADRQMLVVEANALLRKPLIPEWSKLLEEIGEAPKVKIHCWSPRKAEKKFLEAYYKHADFR